MVTAAAAVRNPTPARLAVASPQVAIYSPADRLQSHRYNADESYCVGTTDMQPVSCYLDIESIIKIAKEAEVDAIHPGYGFLSENTTFARRCAEEGITFIGPKAETIEVRSATAAAVCLMGWDCAGMCVLGGEGVVVEARVFCSGARM
jgi:pyruvate carboxylase